jgi:ABC-type lipoprotein export system ATPase subunit
MKAHLMYQDRDFDPKSALPANAAALTKDLELDVVFAAMTDGDKILLEVCRHAVLTDLRDPMQIRYRQEVLADCLELPHIVRRTYALAVEALEGEKKTWPWSSRHYPDGLLHRSLDVMRIFLPYLRGLRKLAEENGSRFKSPGFTTLWGMLARELGEEYLGQVEDHLARLKFPAGVVLSAGLGDGNKGSHYVLREPPPILNWWDRLREWRETLFAKGEPIYEYQVAERDEAGQKALGELRGRGIARAARALARSAEHIVGFFKMLQSELAFYVGCLNLRDRLVKQGENICLPQPSEAASLSFSAKGLYDVALALQLGQKVTANDVSADAKSLVMITGANRGGKSTLLRGIGQAQVMMQCGMFTASQTLHANVCNGIFTHYKREEDSTMRSGKLDEELQRMSWLVDHLQEHSLLLLNESFGSTNELEGSAIARQIVRALIERGVKVVYVTHLFELAQGFCKQKMEQALFLRAERLPNGQRTFQVLQGEPLPTSYGEDLYRSVFANELQQMREKRKASEQPRSSVGFK